MLERLLQYLILFLEKKYAIVTIGDLFPLSLLFIGRDAIFYGTLSLALKRRQDFSH
jgi:hypothetical protein